MSCHALSADGSLEHPGQQQPDHLRRAGDDAPEMSRLRPVLPDLPQGAGVERAVVHPAFHLSERQDEQRGLRVSVAP